VGSQKGVGFRIQHPIPVARLPDGSHSWHLCLRFAGARADILGLDGFPSAQRIACALSACFEFVHIAQYERLGREGFLEEYIQQIAAPGYLNAPFELEAEAKASNACHVVRLAKRSSFSLKTP
jgi:hypothetical protein